MSERKPKEKNNGKKEKDSLKEDLGLTEESIMDEDEVIEDDFIESVDDEDNPEFINEVKKFEDEHKNAKVISAILKLCVRQLLASSFLPRLLQLFKKGFAIFLLGRVFQNQKKF